MDLQKPAGASQPDGCTENVSDRSAVRGAEDDTRGRQKIKGPNGTLIQGDTAEVIAHEHKIGRNTVKRAAKFSKGVDAAEKIESGAREAILSGKSKVPKSVITELPEMEQGKGVFASATVVLNQDRGERDLF